MIATIPYMYFSIGAQVVIYLDKFEKIFKVLLIVHCHPGLVISPNTIVFHFSIIPRIMIKEKKEHRYEHK